MATDKELVKRVQNGESEAYAELFRRYYRRIYTICVSMVRNPQDAEELAQEMFVHAYLKVGQLRDPARFFPWLKKMTRNRSRNFIQRREANVIPLSLVGAKKSSANPEEEILRQELIQAVMEAIEALPVRDRQVVKARIDGLSHTEISRRFSISYRASLSRLYRARKKLTERLKGLYNIFGLAGRLGHKWIISGGVAAVKVGTGAKVTIGVIGVLVVGFTGFKIVMHQPDQEVLLPHQTTQETPQEPIGNLLSKQEPSVIPVRKSNPMLGVDSIEDSIKDEDLEAFLTFLEELENEHLPGLEETSTGDTAGLGSLSPQQQRKLYERAREIEQIIAAYAAEYRELAKLRDSSSGAEFQRLQHRTDSLSITIGELAAEYNAIVPGRPLFDPDSKISRSIQGIVGVGNIVIYE